MKGILVVLFVGLFVGTSFGQVREAVIKTSSECGACKKRIEEKLNYTAGIKFAELHVPTKELTVRFSAKKITLAEIKKIVSEIGYDADEVKANPTSVKKLPACCKPGGMGH